LSETFIYTLKDPITNEIKYVGKSDNPESRLVEHIRKSKYSKTYKNNWIISLLKKDLKPILEILDIVDIDNWSFWEKYWISQFRTWGFKLTNISDGGDGGNFGPECNKKISLKLKNRVFSEDTIKKMKLSAKLRKITDEGRKKLSLSRMGSKNSMFGKKQSKFCIESKFKPIIQISLNGDIIKEWGSLKEVSEYLLINRNTIRMVCQNKRKTAGGYKWKFVEKNE
jgi:group I intron endonuclease